MIYFICEEHLIIYDPSKALNEEEISNKLNDYWYGKKYVSKKDLKNLRRVKRIDSLIIYCPFMDISINDFLELDVFSNISLEKKCLSKERQQHMSDIIKLTKNENGERYGGIATDCTKIDKGIIQLVNVINSFPGVKTFSSCDGHGIRSPYVLFTIDTIENLTNISLAISQATIELDKRYNIILDKTFQYGYWNNIKKVYFELRIRQVRNPNLDYKDNLKYIKHLARLLKKYSTEN